jgi:hypothetical protein
MVWNVFAPRLLFEVLEFLTAVLFTFIILISNNWKRQKLREFREKILGKDSSKKQI